MPDRYSEVVPSRHFNHPSNEHLYFNENRSSLDETVESECYSCRQPALLFSRSYTTYPAQLVGFEALAPTTFRLDAERAFIDRVLTVYREMPNSQDNSIAELSSLIRIKDFYLNSCGIIYRTSMCRAGRSEIGPVFMIPYDNLRDFSGGLFNWQPLFSSRYTNIFNYFGDVTSSAGHINSFIFYLILIKAAESCLFGSMVCYKCLDAISKGTEILNSLSYILSVPDTEPLTTYSILREEADFGEVYTDSQLTFNRRSVWFGENERTVLENFLKVLLNSQHVCALTLPFSIYNMTAVVACLMCSTGNIERFNNQFIVDNFVKYMKELENCATTCGGVMPPAQLHRPGLIDFSRHPENGSEQVQFFSDFSIFSGDGRFDTRHFANIRTQYRNDMVERAAHEVVRDSLSYLSRLPYMSYNEESPETMFRIRDYEDAELETIQEVYTFYFVAFSLSIAAYLADSFSAIDIYQSVGPFPNICENVIHYQSPFMLWALEPATLNEGTAERREELPTPIDIRHNARPLNFFTLPAYLKQVRNLNKDFAGKNRLIGCEIEVASIGPALIKKRNNLFELLDSLYISTNYDASIRGMNPMEFALSPAVGFLWEKNTKRFCDALLECNATVNDSTGVHFHIDASDFKTSNLLNAILTFAMAEPFILKILPESRRDNNYARMCGWKFVTSFLRERDNIEKSMDILAAGSLPSKKVFAKKNKMYNWLNRAAVNRMMYGSINAGASKTNRYESIRYFAMNLHSFFYRGTIEFRGLHGTIDPNVIINWGYLYSDIISMALGINERDFKKRYFKAAKMENMNQESAEAFEKESTRFVIDEVLKGRPATKAFFEEANNALN